MYAIPPVRVYCTARINDVHGEQRHEEHTPNYPEPERDEARGRGMAQITKL